MTVIDFYTHIADPLAVTIQLVRKAYAQYGNVRVLTKDEAMTDKLDKRLWIEPPHDFLPHCCLNSSLSGETPILLDHRLEHDGPAVVLINLQSQPPSFFSRFERLAEIVAGDDEALNEGRQRYHFYKARGYELRTHKLSAHD
ncbi:MAG: DNA polymerase III subunit chi [Burkholderiales bacterium]|jgi:DNA polymerase-3 subunit chi|nr:DNA polymerase III subunit chi [Burkholderiales bacterium]